MDLVTLDDLSAEAMLESSQRIEQLAEIFRQKQQPMTDPGPPSTLPMTVKNANCLSQAFVLFTYDNVNNQIQKFTVKPIAGKPCFTRNQILLYIG